LYVDFLILTNSYKKANVVATGYLKVFSAAVTGISYADLNLASASTMDEYSRMDRLDVCFYLDHQRRYPVSICMACLSK
jgi:hypothetical protein